MWLVDSFCVGVIRQSARLFGASGRHFGRTPMSIDLQSAYTFLNCSFPYRPALVHGVQSGAAQHRHATDVLYRADFGTWRHVRSFPVHRVLLILSHAADG